MIAVDSPSIFEVHGCLTMMGESVARDLGSSAATLVRRTTVLLEVIRMDIDCTPDSLQMHAQDNTVKTRDGTWKPPPSAGATPMLPELPDLGGPRKLGVASELRGALELRDAS